MLNKTDLKQISQTRLAEARILLRNKKYEGSIHLCVCSIEMALKKIICDTLKWKGFPEKRGEFSELESFKTHRAQILLKLSGRELEIKKNTRLWANWSIIQNAEYFDIEIRYKPKGTVNKVQAEEVIDATSHLLRFLK